VTQTSARVEQSGLRKELGLGDLILAQVLCVVGSSWVGVAAKLGRTHVILWLAAMLLFYLPLAATVICLNRILPLEGGLYQWAKAAFGPGAGFLIAWNLWVYALIVTGAIIFVVPTDLGYMFGASAGWLASSKLATAGITGAILAAIALVAVRGLDVGKWLHNIGSAMILLAYAILLGLPLWALARGSITHFEAIPLALPKADFLTLAVFGQMTVGALSGFEYVAIMAGETRSAGRTIGRSVMISAPIIALMFILGTSSVLTFVGSQPINLIGPIPQAMRIAFGAVSWIAPFAILLVIARAIAAASLIFTGLTRLPMTAGWDNLVPGWFTRLHPVHRTPVNSILFVALFVMALIVLSMLGVREQEANQLLGVTSTVHYAIVYVALFAIPLWGRISVPRWLKLVAILGLAASAVSLFFAVYPLVEVVSRAAYIGKISAAVVVTNLAGFLIYRLNAREA
jgi:glutamate:GABA antiporter